LYFLPPHSTATRNDELCVLYEKAHLQEALLAKGQVALQTKDNELRVLGLQLGELQRSIAAARASLPDTTGVDKTVAEIKAGKGNGGWRAGNRTEADLEGLVDSQQTPTLTFV
jgi:hypothetical protein